MKRYEFMIVRLPDLREVLADNDSAMKEVLEELNRLGEEEWKESFKHGTFLVLRRKKPDGVLKDEPYESNIPSMPQ